MRITSLQVLDRPPGHLAPPAYGGGRFASPDGALALAMGLVREVSMGLGDYDLRLEPAGADPATLPALDIGFPGRPLVHLPDAGYQPWTFDSRELVFAFHGRYWGKSGLVAFPAQAPVAYRVRDGSMRTLPVAAKRFTCLLCSPSAPVVLLCSSEKKDNAWLAPLTGDAAPQPFTISDGGAAWIGNGSHLLVFSQDPGRREYRLRLLHPETGAEAASQDPGPDLHEALGWGDYPDRRVTRLNVPDGNMILASCQRYRLGPVLWDEASGAVYLGAYRPVGEPARISRWFNRWSLPVARCWVRMALALA